MMGICVKQSDGYKTLKSSDDLMFSRPIIESQQCQFNESLNPKPMVKEIIGKRRRDDQREYLMSTGDKSEWVTYTNDWQIQDQQLALEYEKHTTTQTCSIELNQSIGNTVLDVVSSNSNIVPDLDITGPELNNKEAINTWESLYSQELLIDTNNLDLTTINVPPSRKQQILNLLEKNKEYWQQEVIKLFTLYFLQSFLNLLSGFRYLVQVTFDFRKVIVDFFE